MRPLAASRQLILFLAALFLPCGVLVALVLRVMSQEEELDDKRRADARVARARSAAEELRAALVSAAAANWDAMRRGTLSHPAVVAVLPLERGRIVPPWTRDPAARAFAAALRERGFAHELSAGQRAELVDGRRTDAAAAYTRAAHTTRSHAAAAYARFLAIRAGAAPERLSEAAWRGIVTLAADLRDDEGIPIAVHAFAQLAPLSRRSAGTRSAFERLSRSMAALAWLSPTACHALVATDRTEWLSATRCAELDRVEQLAGQSAPRTGAWRAVGEGDSTWLLFTAGAAAGDTVVVLARLDSILIAAADDGPLTAISRDSSDVALPGGEGLWLARREPVQGATPTRMLYLLSVVLTIVVAALGGFLLLREVRRESAAVRLRSQFVAGVTHELKTPLTSIRMFAETLRDRALPDEQRAEYLDTVVGETQRLTRLLNNVLEFSRVDRGERRYALAPVDLRDVVDAALRAMRHPLEQLGFTVMVQRDTTPLVVSGDADAIEQAVLNLLGNAVKYSADSRDLRLSVCRRGAEAVVAVTDFGVGIPAREQARIFEKFYRAPVPINHSVAGTGLGLTLVKHIVEAHGGAVQVRSAEGRGSTFELRFPLGGTRVGAASVLANLDPAVAG